MVLVGDSWLKSYLYVIRVQNPSNPLRVSMLIWYDNSGFPLAQHLSVLKYNFHIILVLECAIVLLLVRLLVLYQQFFAESCLHANFIVLCILLHLSFHHDELS